MAKIITGKVRFSYAKVWEAVAMNEGETPKFSTSIIIPKSDTKTINAIKAAIEQTKQDGKAKWGGKIPPTLKTPLRDGDIDRPEDEIFANSYFLNASSTRQPQIVDASVSPILDKDEFYSGCYGRASINFYAFDAKGNRGIAAGLENIQKLADGERLGGGAATAEADFGDGALD